MPRKSRIDAPVANVALCERVGARVEFIRLRQNTLLAAGMNGEATAP